MGKETLPGWMHFDIENLRLVGRARLNNLETNCEGDYQLDTAAAMRTNQKQEPV